MSTKTAAAKRQWVSASEAMRLAGITRAELMKRATLGQVRTLSEPGFYMKFSVEDLAKLAGSKITTGRPRPLSQGKTEATPLAQHGHPRRSRTPANDPLRSPQ